MDDKELVEVWRKEFEKWFIGDLDISLKRDKAGNYTFMNAYSAWNAWLAAKRSQPVIELPNPDTHCFDDDEQKDVWSYSKKSIVDAITAAGYQYTEKK